jgi:hypothetical protein
VTDGAVAFPAFAERVEKMPSNQRRGTAHGPLSAPHGRDTSSLQELLRELAFILISRGISLKGFSELSRSAFVQAAAGLSRLQNGRVNYSRVAATTGLSRADVKRLLEDRRTGALVANQQTAVERVLNGWRHDTRFSRNGKARYLRIVGSTTSFNSLAKKYGGDVPYRAVLTELQRIGAVTVDHERVRLRPRHLRKSYDLGSFSVALPALIDGLKIAAATKKPDIATSIHRLLLPVDSDLDLAFVRERCISTVKTMLDGLRHSLGAKAQPRNAGGGNAAFAVTVLLVESSAKKQHRQRRKRSAHGK